MFTKASIVALLLIAFSYSNLAAQTPTQASPGTYQFICSNKKVQEVFTDDVLFIIEENRDPVVEKIITVGVVTKVRILPYSVINAPGFIPLSEEILYPEEETINNTQIK